MPDTGHSAVHVVTWTGSGRWQVNFKLKWSIPCDVKAMNFGNFNWNVDFGEKRRHQKIKYRLWGQLCSVVYICEMFNTWNIYSFWQFFFLKSTDDYSVVSTCRPCMTPYSVDSYSPWSLPPSITLALGSCFGFVQFLSQSQNQYFEPNFRPHVCGFCYNGPCLWGSWGDSWASLRILQIYSGIVPRVVLYTLDPWDCGLWGLGHDILPLPGQALHLSGQVSVLC